MPRPLREALDVVRPLLLDTDHLVRAVAAGHRRTLRPKYARVELRPVELKGGRHLQVVTTDDLGPRTTNLDPKKAQDVVDDLLQEPFGNWHVETTTETVQVRVTKKGEAQVHTAARERDAPTKGHDRAKQHLIDPADPLFARLGADAAKRRQVDAFLRLLAPAAKNALAQAQGRDLHVVDLGCGNAYLTFAAHRYLTDLGGETPVRTQGIDVRPEMAVRNQAIADELGLEGLTFRAGTIADTEPEDHLDLALALHACDTATDDALAQAVRRGARAILAAPCCHHDVQRQLTQGPEVPHPYAALTRHGILRERFADVLTDAVRADILRILGHRVDVVEFIDSAHTPRNAMIRAVRTGTTAPAERRAEYEALVGQWHLTPALAERLAPELAAEFASHPAGRTGRTSI